jgi:hypothetical protein
MGSKVIYRIFYPTSVEHTFFSAAPGTLSNIDHILDHKESLNKSKKNQNNFCI